MELTDVPDAPSTVRPKPANGQWHPYLFAAAWAAGKSVLDLGSGDGDGCALFAETCDRVVGIDIDPGSICRAREAYRRPNLDFIAGSVDAVPVAGENVFDLVVCFETIEHLDRDQQRACLTEVERLLKPDGVFLVSMPNRHVSNLGLFQANPDHRLGFATDEFASFLDSRFAVVHRFGQHADQGSHLWPLRSERRVIAEERLADGGGDDGSMPVIEQEARTVVAVCSNAPIPGPVGSGLLDPWARATEGRVRELGTAGHRLEDAEAAAYGEREIADWHRADLEGVRRNGLAIVERLLDDRSSPPAHGLSASVGLRTEAEAARPVEWVTFARLAMEEREARRVELAEAQRWHTESLAALVLPLATAVVKRNGHGKASTATATARATSIDVVICVHNALDDVRRCLASVIAHTRPRHRIVLVDDGSDEECRRDLESFAEGQPRITLIRNQAARGYTKAANQGLHASTADLVVLLNSDTIVTPRWLERIAECAKSDPAIGIVGPVSNAASYQSVPERFGADGDWALNPLPEGWAVDQVGEAVAAVSPRSFPRVPVVNGFCFAVTRGVIDAIGYLDEEGFPDGYGEENDFCLRATAAGFGLAVADHAYVFHAKSRSYSHERRRELGRLGRSVVLGKHGAERMDAAETALRDAPALATVRQLVRERLTTVPPTLSEWLDGPSVLFLLPVSGGSGGAHSIVQEASGMRALGADAQVAVSAKHEQRYRADYFAIGGADPGGLFYFYPSENALMAHAAGFDVVVGTIHTSTETLKKIVAADPDVQPAYYVQDYEPFFYLTDSPERQQAVASYTRVPGATLFAKTRWLCDAVERLHGVQVHKVEPSIDHDVYFPALDATSAEKPVRVTAMIRPRTPRRGAGRTMEVLSNLAERFGATVDVHVFGCEEGEFAQFGLETDFPFTTHGRLTQEGVADLLRSSDVFLDLSDYQAFGRTGLQAMACGCAVVVPAAGGTDEYACHRANALVVDTERYEECLAAAEEVVADAALRSRLRAAAIETARAYSIPDAARSELRLLREESRLGARARSAVKIGDWPVSAVAPVQVAEGDSAVAPGAAVPFSVPQVAVVGGGVGRHSNPVAIRDRRLSELKKRLLLVRRWSYLRYQYFREGFLSTGGVGSVLAVGSGRGLAELALAVEFSEVRFHLTDIAPHYQRAQELVDVWRLPNVTFGLLDILNPDREKSERFDLVASVEVLEHLEDDALAAARMKDLANKYVFALVPFADERSKGNETLQQEHWRKHEHFRVGYDEPDLRRLFPDVVRMQGCYWADGGTVWRRRLDSLSDAEIIAAQPELVAEAALDNRLEIPRRRSQGCGIWAVARTARPAGPRAT